MEKGQIKRKEIIDDERDGRLVGEREEGGQSGEWEMVVVELAAQASGEWMDLDRENQEIGEGAPQRWWSIDRWWWWRIAGREGGRHEK